MPITPEALATVGKHERTHASPCCVIASLLGGLRVGALVTALGVTLGFGLGVLLAEGFASGGHPAGEAGHVVAALLPAIRRYMDRWMAQE